MLPCSGVLAKQRQMTRVSAGGCIRGSDFLPTENDMLGLRSERGREGKMPHGVSGLGALCRHSWQHPPSFLGNAPSHPQQLQSSLSLQISQ